MVRTNFPAFDDIDHQYLLISDWCARFYPLLTYRVLVIEEALVDDVHDELPDYEKTWTDITLRSMVIPADQVLPLTVFGIEELRDVILQVSVPDLIAAGLASQDATTRVVTLTAKTGDRFVHTSGEYDILFWKIGGTLANMDVPTFYVASAEKVRMDARPYEGL